MRDNRGAIDARARAWARLRPVERQALRDGNPAGVTRALADLLELAHAQGASLPRRRDRHGSLEALRWWPAAENPSDDFDSVPGDGKP